MNLRRNPGSCFIKNYNLVLLKAWEANLDIQPVRNYYKALTCMTAYLSKSESARQIRNQKVNARDSMRKLHIHLQVHANCLSISFIIENLPENSIRMIKSKEELKVLLDYSTDIFK